MATLYPDWKTIGKLNPPHTEGERRFLHFLDDELDDEYEVFFQPYLNGDEPDIVLMRKGGGVLVIEVKDWNLDHYYLDSRRHWRLKKNDSPKLSPLDQVLKYKKNLYDLHIEDLISLELSNYKHWYVVSCGLYFHHETKADLWSFLTEKFRGDENYSSYKYFLGQFAFFGQDFLKESFLDYVLRDQWISKDSPYFTDDLYESFKRRLKPSWHSLENTVTYTFDDKQKELIENPKDRREQKVKGIAGSGKTLILAHRAVQAHKRTGKRVLILTYNISLKNYIHDRVSGVREEFGWSNFHILNYHYFISLQMNNLGVPFNIPDNFDKWDPDRRDRFFEENYYSNLNLFEAVEDRINKYSAVFIDEFQDYRENWTRMIKKYFLVEGGELVIFADWGQDIYGRENQELETTPVRGRWNELDTPHRQQNPALKVLNIRYQQEFFLDAYDPRPKDATLELFGSLDAEENVAYTFSSSFNPDELAKRIYEQMVRLEAHPNDACVMAFSVESVRKLDLSYQNLTAEKTETMCETVEEYEEIDQDCKRYVGRVQRRKNLDSREKEKIERRCIRKKVERVRRSKKWNFWMNAGTTKFSTVHSFKGWEVHTLFLVVEDDFMEEALQELIYTGFTRCSNNLTIFNIGDDSFDTFIREVKDEMEIEILG